MLVHLAALVIFGGMFKLDNRPPTENIETPDPDFYRNVSELISSKGYPVENHVVQTEDGFLLSVQHIPHGRHDADKSGGGREVVFLQHGFLSASHTWVLNFPHQSLGFILADAGYDVWLGNTRGNAYSRTHVKYTPDQKEFWENSTFSDMGYYDIPAMVDYVLNATGQQQLSYVGHSQGTTACFAMLSERPEYNRKIKALIALAPVTTLAYMTNPLRYVAHYKTEIEILATLSGWRDFLPNYALVKLFSQFVCARREPGVCNDALSILFGESKQLNATRIHVYTSHTPSGSSMKSMFHYGQLYLSRRFEKYDYGWKGNLHHYGQVTPPEYDLSSITTPIAVAWACEDNLADPRDVALLLKKLKSVVDVYQVPFQPFNHVDFTLGLHAKSLVYDKVLEWLKNIPLGW